MTKFKNIKKNGPAAIAAAQIDYKLVKPLAGPTKGDKKTEAPSKRMSETPKRVEAKVARSLRPKKVGTFATILFVTIVLQIVLLISLLYLSPKLIR